MIIDPLDIDPFVTTHVVLTRFAVRQQRDGAIPNADWITRRCALFEQYCLPSMRSQTIRDFTWILLFDPEIDGSAHSRFKMYEQELPGLRFWPAGHFNDVTAIQDAIANAMRPDSARLITTRLDNDDMVSHDHIERIRRAAAVVPRQERVALIFTSGFELAGDRLYWRPFPRSPFASLVEPAECGAPTTIMAIDHESVDCLGRVIELGSPAAWTQVIHGDNILNRVRGIRIPNWCLTRTFTVRGDRTIRRDSWLELSYGIPASLLRLARDILRNPRYVRKIAELLTPNRRRSDTD